MSMPRWFRAAVHVIVLVVVFFWVCCSRTINTIPTSAPETAMGQVFLIGLDGASWVVLHPMMKMGQLPVLNFLNERGARSRCQTIKPTLSPIIWTSIATGREASDHGIVNFTRMRPRTDEMINFSAADRRVPALWEIMSHFKLPGIYINWLMSWPVDEVNGVMVGDRWTADLPDMAYPKTWHEHIRQLVSQSGPGRQRGHDAMRADNAQSPSPSRVEVQVDRMNNVQSAMQLVEFNPVKDDVHIIVGLFCRAFTEVSPRLGMLYLNNLDPASHHNWAGIEQGSDQPADTIIGRKARHIMQLYRDMDAVMGRICSLIKEPATIIIVSDHGMESRELKPVHFSVRDLHLDALLYRIGLIELDEKNRIRWDTSRVYTVLFDRYSLVATVGLNNPTDIGIEVQDICQRLTGIVTSVSRLPLVSGCRWNKGDSTLEISFNKNLTSLENLYFGEQAISAEDIILRSYIPPGHHSDAPPGVLIMHGPLVRPGLIDPTPHIDDIFPTTAALLGLPLAEDLAGKPLFQVLDREIPIKTIPSYGERGMNHPILTTDDPSAKTTEWERERLRSLGYIE